jgi:hypothetical protein
MFFSGVPNGFWPISNQQQELRLIVNRLAFLVASRRLATGADLIMKGALTRSNHGSLFEFQMAF